MSIPITRVSRPRMYQIIRPENGGPTGTLEAEFCYIHHALAYAIAHCGAWHVMRVSTTKVEVSDIAAHSIASLLVALGEARP